MSIRVPYRNLAGDQLLAEKTNAVGEKMQQVIPGSGRLVSAQVNVSAFRTLGAADTFTCAETRRPRAGYDLLHLLPDRRSFFRQAVGPRRDFYTVL